MNSIPLTIGASILVIIGSAGFLGLALPEVRDHLLPHWAVAFSSASLIIAGIGLWRKRKWALIFFLFTWGAQVIHLLILGLPARWGSGLAGLAIVAVLSATYWRELKW